MSALAVGPRDAVTSPNDMNQESTVFVVDDNPGVCQSILALAESAGLRAETFPSAREFLDAYRPDRAGCLVLDIRLRGSSGLDLQDELLRRRATLPIIVLTAYANVPTSIRAFKSGAFDFLRKPVPPDQLLERIGAAIELDRRNRAVAAESEAIRRRIARLTRREYEVMELMVAGKMSKEIAGALDLSVRTVEGHRRVVLRKMQVTSAAQLVRDVLIARGEVQRAT